MLLVEMLVVEVGAHIKAVMRIIEGDAYVQIEAFPHLCKLEEQLAFPWSNELKEKFSKSPRQLRRSRKRPRRPRRRRQQQPIRLQPRDSANLAAPLVASPSSPLPLRRRRRRPLQLSPRSELAATSRTLRFWRNSQN